MHPEIVRERAGLLVPICGMALEPRTVAAAEEENPELRDMTRRFWWSVVLGVPLVVLAMLRMGPLVHVVSPRTGNVDRVAARDAGGAVGGWPFFQRGWASVKLPQPEHVHADRAGRGCGVRLQRDRHVLAADLSASHCAACTASRRSTSNLRRRSSCWCCWGRCWS